MKPKKILMVAGEVSGDLHGAHLARAVHRIDPGVEFLGVGGEGLEREGMRRLYPARALSVVGITEVLPKIRSILKAFKILKQALDREKPDLVVLIDFPDFNLRLARVAHRRKIPVLYYISPQVWAWRPGRVKQISQWVKKMIVFFPFEVPIYRQAGVDVEWVGHPLVDIASPSLSREEAFRRFHLDPDRRTIGLLPGSRASEITRLLPTLLGSAERLQKEVQNLQFLIPLASSIPKAMVRPFLEKVSLPVSLIEGQTYDVMNVSDLLITASGTATLEAAVVGTPMVIVYKVSALSYWVGRCLIRVDHIGLVNLVAGRRVMPELIQRDANPERIKEEALRILKDPTRSREMREAMAEVRQLLGQPGAAERAARIVYSLVQNGTA
jgi:lipid-A-disaccharide synthase